MTQDLKTISPHDFRILCRKATYTGQTSGLCEGYAQANLIVLPKEYERDFVNLCLRNPVPCPLLCKTPPGNSKFVDDRMILWDQDIDLSTDFPSYNVYENGQFKEKKTVISKEWSEDHVGFLIGCSHSFETELTEKGLPPRHQTLGRGVPVYKTKKYLDPAGIFSNCTYVVSMRPYKPENLDMVRKITSQYGKTHGEPIDWGFDGAERLGIKNLESPDFGDEPQINDGEIPVFWGCGVTPQLVVMQLGNKIEGTVMSHTTGAMLSLDILSADIKKLA